MLARSRRSVLVVDSGTPRNAPAEAMHGFIVLDGIAPVGDPRARSGAGPPLRRAGRLRRGRLGRARGTGRRRSAVRPHSRHSRSVSARRVLVATGLRDVLPEVPGLAGHSRRGALPLLPRLGGARRADRNPRHRTRLPSTTRCCSGSSPTTSSTSPTARRWTRTPAAPSPPAISASSTPR
ncbi:hypothetical protein [Streptomyces malaysiensis]|uniref:hypothetical protein n=1 Tax=Streptomyces malaysiensis TaxID=92644 RepID=UPI00385140C3